MDANAAIDECYRCGYDLRGIADEQACPECGLLAVRSRRKTDELHHTRPRWLWSMEMGIWVMLLSLLFAVIWQFIAAATIEWVRIAIDSLSVRGTAASTLFAVYFLLGVICICVCIPIGAWLLTRPEGHGPADAQDRVRRRLLRMASLVPLTGIVATVTASWIVEWYWNSRTYSIYDSHGTLDMCIIGLGRFSEFIPAVTVLFTALLPVLLFYQLRSLAMRARSAHLAEHCAIVGIGTSASVIHSVILFLISQFSEPLHLGGNWSSNSTSALLLTVLLCTAAMLFFMWSIYLLIRFAIAFHRASKALRSGWNRDDRSLQSGPQPS